MPVKNRLREIRHKLLIDKQTDFADKIGIERKHYNRYERQKVQPNLETALQIAIKLNMTVDEIFYIEPDD